MSLTAEEKKQAIAYAANDAQFFFLPTPELRTMMVKGHPMTTGIIDPLKGFLMDGKAVKLTPKMVLDYCTGRLDKKNTWLLDQGHIKVSPPKIEL
jgi:hypothetical protein